MVTLTDREKGDPDVLRGTDALIERTMAKQMSSRVDEPRGMEHEPLTIDVAHEEGGERILVPDEDGDEGGDQQSKQSIDGIVVPVGLETSGTGSAVTHPSLPFLEADDFVIIQVGERETRCLFQETGVLPHDEPSHV